MTAIARIPALVLILATLTASGATMAAEGVARRSGAMRAGPQTDYPLITWVRRGQHLDVYGCLAGGSWCDVELVGNRGWFPGSRLTLIDKEQRLRAPDAGAAVLGLSVLSFDMARYWQDHYGNRTFFHNDRHWRRDGTRTPPALIPPPVRPPHADATPHKPRPEDGKKAPRLPIPGPGPECLDPQRCPR